MGISEIIILMLVYGGLYIYTWQMVSSKNKVIVYTKSIVQIILYVFVTTDIWFTFKGKEYHTNNHSGLEQVNYTGAAILMIAVFSIYNVILLLLNRFLKRNNSTI